MTTLVCFWFHSLLLPWWHFIPKYKICPLRLAKGGPWNAVCPTTTIALSLIAYSYSRIIPSGCAAKPLSTLAGITAGWRSSWCVPSNWCNFDLRKEIEGFISSYVMTQKYISVLFLPSEAVCCPIVSPCKCASASCNPMNIHWHSVQGPGEQEPAGD